MTTAQAKGEISARPALSQAEFFDFYFAELGRRGIPHVILHSYQGYPHDIPSDVDYAVPHTFLRQLPAVQQEIAAAAGWRLAQVLDQHISAVCSILFSRTDARQSLKLDVCSHYVEDHVFFLEDKVLLEGRRAFKGFFVPAPEVEFLYILAKVTGKRKSLATYQKRLAELHSEAPSATEALLTRVFPEISAPAGDLLGMPEKVWGPLAETIRRQKRYWAAHYLNDFRRLARRMAYPTGLTIGFLGPDGAGKSSVIEAVADRLQPTFRASRIHHFRPHTFEKKGGNTVQNPHASPPRGWISGMVKLLYYLGDHWAGYFRWTLPGRLRSTLSIFDRTLEDILVDQRRYRLALHSAFPAAAARLAPGMDRKFALVAPADILHRRKQELPVPELERQVEALRELASRHEDIVLIDVSEPLPAVIENVTQSVLEIMEARTAKSWNLGNRHRF